MALMFREANRFDVKFGGDRDVCFYCLKELWEKHKGASIDEFNLVMGRRELEGELAGEKVWSQGDIVICKRHSKIICDELGCDELPDEQQETAKA